LGCHARSAMMRYEGLVRNIFFFSSKMLMERMHTF
jgi:hypothetical protein